MSHVPTDPTVPRDPVLVPRARPAAVSLAAVLMLAGAVIAMAHAIAAVAISASIAVRFTEAAAGLAASPDEIRRIGAAVGAAFLASGVINMLLAGLVIALALGLLRRNNTARIAAIVVVAISVLCSSAGALAAASAGMEDHSRIVTLEQGQIDIGEPLQQAIPSWFASLTTGVGCLQVLGYIAVVALLLLPASHAYFRRRLVAATPSSPPSTAPPAPQNPPDPPPASGPVAADGPDP